MAAVTESLAAELGIPASLITANLMIVGRRNLLSNAVLTYGIPVDNHNSAKDMRQKLETIMDTGSFFRTLEVKSGVSVSAASPLYIAMDEVTASPSPTILAPIASGKTIHIEIYAVFSNDSKATYTLIADVCNTCNSTQDPLYLSSELLQAVS